MTDLGFVEMLTSTDPESRLNAAERLGDLLQYHAERPDSRILAQIQRVTFVNLLIDAIANETKSSEAREAMANALAWGSCNAPSIDWQRLVNCLPDLDRGALEHALTSLGNSGNKSFVPLLSQYLRSNDPLIRSAAEDGLAVLNLGGCASDTG